MARCLIIGCGCRGRSLAAALRRQGHAVRGTTRRAAYVDELEAAGIEPHLADPDRVVTLAPAFDHVSVACVLLGSATGGEEALRALHGSRLEMLLERMLDTTIRGIVYEAAGTVGAKTLAGGAEIVRRRCRDSLIPYALLESPAASETWLGEALSAVQRLLATPG